MNHKNNINFLEAKISSLMSNCLEGSVDKSNLALHPIRLMESAKSLLGLNLENPNQEIIDFMDNILISKEKRSNSQSRVYSETVSIYQLEDAIKESDYNKCEELVESLTQLSDGKHILEFLLELSLLQKGRSVLVVWAGYKIVKFINSELNKYIKFAILISCKALMIDDFFDSHPKVEKSINDVYNNYELNLRELQTVGVLLDISNSKFIRSDRINLNIFQFSSFFYSSINKKYKFPQNQLIDNKLNKNSLLSVLKKKTISQNLILSLDAIRLCMKYSSDNNNLRLQIYIDKLENI